MFKPVHGIEYFSDLLLLILARRLNTLTNDDTELDERNHKSMTEDPDLQHEEKEKPASDEEETEKCEYTCMKRQRSVNTHV